ncbi:hypothetical protein HanXRQr2_Chr08g0345851 [Helianthus annuus]|uniref:Putative kinesin motor domain-containing protein n=1 Tax=Helianthus annuus TaxID=4232 RepID=A0A251U6S7_HELAN|nr:hypothetical protein HanXRQr2_Chr08g0345851 [Helianthus annuus]
MVFIGTYLKKQFILKLKLILLSVFSSATETLNTLKFAQRAKLIQNNVLNLLYVIQNYNTQFSLPFQML